MSIVVRSSRPNALLEEVPLHVQAVDPEQAVWRGRLMSERVERSVGNRRHVATLFGAFAVAALLIATLGILGLVSYATTQRTHELGLRMALGSTPEAVVGLVMRGGAILVGVGLALGLPLSVVLTRTMADSLPGIGAFDLTVYAVIAAILGSAGLLACLIPAWRAVRIPPAIALRYE
jgi:ABC-type antimicrobial peptide transport system permease subunit